MSHPAIRELAPNPAFLIFLMRSASMLGLVLRCRAGGRVDASVWKTDGLTGRRGSNPLLEICASDQINLVARCRCRAEGLQEGQRMFQFLVASAVCRPSTCKARST